MKVNQEELEIESLGLKARS